MSDSEPTALADDRPCTMNAGDETTPVTTHSSRGCAPFLHCDGWTLLRRTSPFQNKSSGRTTRFMRRFHLNHQPTEQAVSTTAEGTVKKEPSRRKVVAESIPLNHLQKSTSLRRRKLQPWPRWILTLLKKN